MSLATIAADTAQTSYLGFPLEVTDRQVTVFDKHGRRLVTVASMGAARRFIKGYRRIPANTEATGTPRKSAPMASDPKEATCA